MHIRDNFEDNLADKHPEAAEFLEIYRRRKMAAPVATDSVVTTVKSPWYSKINWAQIVGGVASVAVALGAPLTPEQVVNVVVGIQALVGVFTVVKNTFFSPEVLTPSASGLEVVK